MRFTFLTLTLALTFFTANSQNINYKITYIHCIQYDTAKELSSDVGFQATLVGNGVESNYTMNKIYKKKIDTSSVTVDQALRTAGTYTIKMPGAPADSFGNQVYYNRKIDSIYLREKMPDEYIITKEKTPAINWVITQDTMTILGNVCTLAKADFRGRQYIAYFTSAIPIASGPWKFLGLPGLVLQIQDERNQVKIFATKIEYPASDHIQPFSGSGREIQSTEYVNIRDKNYEKTIRKIEQANSGQERPDKLIVSPKINKTQGVFGIELKAD